MYLKSYLVKIPDLKVLLIKNLKDIICIPIISYFAIFDYCKFIYQIKKLNHINGIA